VNSAADAEAVVLATHLMSAPCFVVAGGEPLPEMVPFGLLTGHPRSRPRRTSTMPGQTPICPLRP
jgi:hypothetical protein